MLQFYPPEDTSFSQVVELLSNKLKLQVEEQDTDKLTIFDTFDWRLYQNSLTIQQHGSKFTLYDWNRQQIIEEIELEESPQFVWDLPPGLLRTTLAPILSVRALLPKLDLYRQKNVLRILNEDEKTVTFVAAKIYYPNKQAENSLLTSLSVEAVRGYDKETEQFIEVLDQANFTLIDHDIMPDLLAAVGQSPGDYSSKLNIDLKPEMRADTATNIILRYLLQIMKMNEAYIKDDVDTEFLHDYRVAVRRTRSALSQIKAVFPKSKTKQFRKDFKFIGKLSNQLRDLDVYLLAEEDYKKQLPEFLQSDIDPLFEYLQEKRVDALDMVVAGLESEEYRRIMQDWEHFLEEPPKKDKTAVNADMPILDLAKKRIYKRYRIVIEKGNLILNDSRDELLHALRIECKKLRYLMEFFASLFPPDKIEILIRQLKHLQKNLGDFNDYCVQEEYLLHVGREMPIRGQPSRDALIAIGCLVGALHQQREMVQNEFEATFNQFAHAENERLFVELFASDKEKKKRGLAA